MALVDQSCVLQVLGSLLKHPQFLSETDKYTLTPTDFYYRLDKYIFVAIDSLYRNGATNLQPIDVENYLSTNESAKILFKEQKGIDYLQDAEALSDAGNFPYYYKKLKKFNLLDHFRAQGFDISEFYIDDPSNVKAIEVNSKFESLEIDDIVNAIKARLLGIEREFIQNDTTEVVNVFEGINDVIADAENQADVGIPIQGEIFNEVCSGARKGIFVLRSAGSGTGKCLPNSTLIPTPNGYRQVGDIREGDYLFDAFGKPTKVLKVFPQGKRKVNYVKFKDGRTALCCEDHLWSYCTQGQRDESKKNRAFQTRSLKELKKMNLKNNKGNYNFLVPMNYAVEYPVQNHYIDSYVFGLALGDGSFRQNESNKSFQFSSEDEWLPNEIGSRMGWVVKRGSEANYTWYFAPDAPATTRKINIWVEDFLCEHRELINCKSEDKFIPKEYLFDSIEHRFDLLAGLLDSDGTVDTKGRIRYTTNSPILKDNVIELAQGLGFKVSVGIDKHKSTSTCYNIQIMGRPEDKIKLFKLPRKRALIIDWFNSNKRKEWNEFNPIVEIGECDYSEEMTCFYVDNDEHLFLMNDYIVTHNTRNAVGDACFIAFPFRYEENEGKWIKCGSGRKVLFIATEQTPKEIQKMILAYLTGFNETKFRYGGFTEQEETIIRQAIWVLEQYQDNFFIVRMPNPTIELVKTIVRENVLMHDIEYVFYDYIHISPSLLNEFKGYNLRNDEILLMFSTALKDLAVELNVFMMSSTQLNAKGDDNSDIKNEAAISGSRSIINKADIGAIMSRPTKEELEFFKTENGVQFLPTLVTDIYKVRAGEWNQVRIWSDANLGNLRKKDLFVTNARMEVLNVGTSTAYLTDWSSEDTQVYNEQLKVVNQIK